MGEDRQGRGAQEGRRPLTGRLEAVPHGDGGPRWLPSPVLPGSRFPQKSSVLAPSFPDGTIPGALHIHSTRSDGRGTLDEIAHAAARAGLKFIVITDHGDATRAPDAPVYREGVLCLDAVEISTAGGHYIALDMPKAPYPLGGQARDVVDDVKRLGGFGIAAHPDSPKAGAQLARVVGAVRRHRVRQPGHELAAADRAGVQRPRGAADGLPRAAPVLVSLPPGRVHRRADSTDRHPDAVGRHASGAGAS